MDDKLQAFKDAPVKKGDTLIVEPVINSWDPITFEKSSNGKSTMEMLQEAKALRLKSMVKCVSPGSNKNPRVQNNNNENADNQSKHKNNSVKNRVINSPKESPKISFNPIQKAGQLNKVPPKYQSDYQMDLNRDLPPLPAPTEMQALQSGDEPDPHGFKSTSDCGLDLLQPLYYDPVRDSLKFGGVHYHPDGMLYYPEVLQHPPRTSSMAAPGASPSISSGTRNPQHEAVGCSKPSITVHILGQGVHGSGRAPDPGHISDASSGILGNFIPVKRMIPDSAIEARAIQIPRIE
jgi:hypothetical protein